MAFSFAIIVFQVSCKKTSEAAPATSSNTTSQQNKIIFQKEFYGGVSNNPSYDYGEIWTANYDGSNPQKLNISLPSGMVIVLSPNGTKLSPDRKTVFFNAYTPGQRNWSIFSCNIDGSNVHLILGSDANSTPETCVAF